MRKSILWWLTGCTLTLSTIILTISLNSPEVHSPTITSAISKVKLSGYQTKFMIGDYNMRNHQNKQVSWKNFSKRPLYITAGFTRCPHTCPMTMNLYQRLAKQINHQADFALLTVDPEHDKPSVLKRYLSAINPSFIGLQIDDKTEFNQSISDLKQSLINSGEPSDLMHSDYIYLLHPKLTGLVLYTKPDIKSMANDLIILNTI